MAPLASSTRTVTILGGGPAGSTAALSAFQHGCPVTIHEKSTFPRHKVCGEFLSPEIARPLEQLGMWSPFQSLQPAIIRRFVLHFGDRWTRHGVLPEAAYGLSRYEFDRLLLDGAVSRGAMIARHPAPEPCNIIACGRNHIAPRGNRLFGFKAHFRGAADDAVELFFFKGCYVGLNSIETGQTNICGLAPEHMLKSLAFNADELLLYSAPLRARIAPLTRTMDWIFTGPLVFGNRLNRGSESAGNRYLCGDALSFVDPFTGSGLLTAVLTGTLAGRAAAIRQSPSGYVQSCTRVIHTQFEISSMLRRIAGTSAAGILTQIVPAEWLFKWTRPRSAA